MHVFFRSRIPERTNQWFSATPPRSSDQLLTQCRYLQDKHQERERNNGTDDAADDLGPTRQVRPDEHARRSEDRVAVRHTDEDLHPRWTRVGEQHDQGESAEEKECEDQDVRHQLRLEVVLACDIRQPRVGGDGFRVTHERYSPWKVRWKLIQGSDQC